MLLSALILGFVSSLHCIAMCGPIAMVLPVSRTNRARRVLQTALYHLGRLTTYSALGLIFGVFGRGLYLAGMQQGLSLFAGVAIISIVLIPEKTFARYNFSKPVYKILSKTKSAMGVRLKNPSLPSVYTIGLLNGLLPCAMVYAALFGALAMQDAALSAVYMAVFGMGTIPLMSGVSILWKLMTHTLRGKIQKAIPFAMVCIGILFIARGLSLGLPVSPSGTNLVVKAMPDCR